MAEPKIVEVADHPNAVWTVGKHGERVVLTAIVGDDDFQFSAGRLLKVVEARSDDRAGIIGDDADGDIHGEPKIRLG